MAGNGKLQKAYKSKHISLFQSTFCRNILIVPDYDSCKNHDSEICQFKNIVKVAAIIFDLAAVNF